MLKVITRSSQETQKVARILAEEIKTVSPKSALVIALEGNLGSGKTTFIQGFAKALGVKEKVLSPTFVLIKIYRLTGIKRFKHLIHIDCYRADSFKDLAHLGLKTFLKDKDALTLIEWADRVKKVLPKDTIWIRFEYGQGPQERVLKFKTQNEKLKITT